MSLEERYIELTPVGTTPLGELLHGAHAALGHAVRICRIPDGADDALVERLRAVAALRHPNIAAIVDADFSSAPAWYVLDGVHGDSLRDRFDAGPLSPDEALRAARDLLRGLLHAHEHGVTHGNLGPSRLLFDASGTLRIGDFGGQAATADPTGSTVAIDTDAMPYLPVHVLRHPDQYDAATDRHCAGSLVMHMLLGEAVEGTAPTEVPGISAGAAAALHGLLARDADLDALRAAVLAFDHADAPAAAAPTPSAPAANGPALTSSPVPAAPPRRRRSSGTMVMSSPTHGGDTGSHPSAPVTPAPMGGGPTTGNATAALERLAGRPSGGGETLLENPYDDPSESVLDALGSPALDETPLADDPPVVDAEVLSDLPVADEISEAAPDEDASDDDDGTPDVSERTDDVDAAVLQAAARARDARERALQKMERYAALFSP